MRVQAVRHGGVRSSQFINKGGECLKDATAFIFCVEETAQPLVHRREDAEDEKHNEARLYKNIGPVDLPPLEVGSLGLLLPAAVAAHGGLLASTGAVCACLPIMAPFSIPQVSPDTWLANKRARAFYRCCALAVYAQGAMALLKFSGGDLVGGTYLGIQTAMGAYSITPDGARLMPSYMMVCGFNGLLGIIQVFQQFQGVPLHYIPFLAILPPAVSLLSCYWGWQYCQELRAIGAGANGEGAQDTCWVKFMGGDVWPLTSLSPSPERSDQDHDRGETSNMGSSFGNRFSAFAGNGQRLGEA